MAAEGGAVAGGMDSPKRTEWPAPAPGWREGSEGQKRPIVTSGVMFGCLWPIPTDDRVDPPYGACFKCWGLDHKSRSCRNPDPVRYCRNCGRRGTVITLCPRCGMTYWNFNEKKNPPKTPEERKARDGVREAWVVQHQAEQARESGRSESEAVAERNRREMARRMGPEESKRFEERRRAREADRRAAEEQHQKERADQEARVAQEERACRARAEGERMTWEKQEQVRRARAEFEERERAREGAIRMEREAARQKLALQRAEEARVRRGKEEMERQLQESEALARRAAVSPEGCSQRLREEKEMEGARGSPEKAKEQRLVQKDSKSKGDRPARIQLTTLTEKELESRSERWRVLHAKRERMKEEMNKAYAEMYELEVQEEKVREQERLQRQREESARDQQLAEKKRKDAEDAGGEKKRQKGQTAEGRQRFIADLLVQAQHLSPVEQARIIEQIFATKLPSEESEN